MIRVPFRSMKLLIAMRFSLSRRATGRRALGFVLMLLCLLPARSAQAQPDRHMLWTISSEDGPEGSLVGSVHLMKPDAYPLGEAYDRAFDAADVVAFELNLDSAATQSPALIQELGLYPQGQSLEAELSPAAYEQFEAFAEDLNLPAARFQRMEPWLVSITLPVIQMQRAGYSPQSGIDMHFFQKAKEAGKRIARFETAAEQFAFFDDLAPEQQEAFLKYSLDQADRNVRRLDEMVAAWQRGDAERLEAMLQDEMQEQFPDIYQTLVVERNENWLPQITAMLEDEAHPMIVVGAAHLVGRDGLVRMLRDAGYTVEQQ